MKYKVKGENNYIGNIQEEFFKNNGVDNVHEYMNITDKHITNPFDFTNMKEAVELFDNHMNKKSNMAVIVDCDVDGFTSASPLYSYLYVNFDIEMDYIVHEKKVHGIILDEFTEEQLNNIDLLFVPDAGSSDFKQHKILKEKYNIDIICIDHHDCDKYSEHAIVVNNKLSKISENLSGSGMTYKFLKALDETYQLNDADDYMDLVALGMIGDMIDVRDREVQYLIKTGLENINNEMLLELLNKTSFSRNGKQNQTAFGFYIAPIINAVVRVGSIEDNRLMFESLVDIGSDKKYYYTPTRGKRKGEMIEENLYEHVARKLQSIKGKQDRLVKKYLEGSKRPLKRGLLETIKDNDDKILVVDGTEYLDNNGTTGLIANKLMKRFRKPVLIYLNKGDDFYSGSARGDFIQNFREKLEKSGLVEKAMGHEFAFGTDIRTNDFNKFTESINEYFKHENIEAVHQVDFAIPFEYLEDYMVEELYQLEDYFGHGLKQPLLYLENCIVPTTSISINDSGTTITFYAKDIQFIIFNTNSEYFDSIVDWTDEVCYNIVGKPSINEYDGQRYVQIIVEDLEYIKNENDSENLDDLEDWDEEDTEQVVTDFNEESTEDFEW